MPQRIPRCRDDNPLMATLIDPVVDSAAPPSVAPLALPKHDEIGLGQRAFGLACIAAVGVLLACEIARLANAPGVLTWSLPLVVAAGMLSADLASGLVHWAADTWGDETMPFVGPRFLRPFRVHHVNPGDFLRRNFIDTNGDVSLVLIPILATALSLPAEGFGLKVGLFLTAFAGLAWPTNQVHQWAHQAAPQRLVAWLQDRRLILSGTSHQRHHTFPHTSDYCMATGWWNRPLTAAGFFPRLERVVTAVTGVPPRHDEEAFLARLENAANPQRGFD
jgi:plasmanylethanolamine desaturase